MTVAEKCKQIIVDQLGCEKMEVFPSTRIVEDLGADSLDAVEIIMELEETFEIDIPDEDVETLTTVQAVIDYLTKRGVPHDAD